MFVDAAIKNVVVNKQDSDNFLIRIEKSLESDNLITTFIPKGSWDMLDAIVGVILEYNPAWPIVEIGMGESTTVLAKHAQRKKIRLYSCDVLMGGMFGVFSEKLFEDHFCFVGRSEDFIKKFKDVPDPPGIVFIDGEHTYEAVKMETDFFLSVMKPGGVMFIHDTFPPFGRYIVKDELGRKPGDIYKVRRELERDPNYDVFTWPYSALGMGLTMVLKYAPNELRPFWMKNGRCDVSSFEP